MNTLKIFIYVFAVIYGVFAVINGVKVINFLKSVCNLILYEQ